MENGESKEKKPRDITALIQEMETERYQEKPKDWQDILKNYRQKAETSRLGLYAITACMVLCFLWAMVFGPSSLFLFQPMHIFESPIYVFFVTLPITSLILFLLRGTLKLVFTTQAHPMKLFGTIISILLVGIIGTFYALNVLADHSAAVPVTLPIIDKPGWECFSKHNSCVTINLPSPSPLPITFFHQESFRLDEADYKRAIPRETQITIYTHKGFLGLPWYESKYLLSR